jgi:hypothetical protein
MKMVLGLSGTARQHTHFFRDLQWSMRADMLAHGQNPTGPGMAPGEAAMAADEQQPSGDGSKEMITELEARNREVLAHEASHMAAAGAYIKGGASYTYQIGPDGKAYAIGGEVSVDMSPVPGNPRATIAKLMVIRADLVGIAPARTCPWRRPRPRSRRRPAPS